MASDNTDNAQNPQNPQDVDTVKYIANLQNELARQEANNKALVEEFKKDISDLAEWSPEDLKKKFNSLLERAYTQLITLLDSADSEAVRLSCVKYIFNVGLGHVKISDANAPNKELQDLLSALAVNSGPDD